MERGIFIAIGSGMALFGGLFFAYFIGELTSGASKNSVGINAGLVVCFGGLFFGGLYLLWRSIRGISVDIDGTGATRPGATAAPGRSAAPPTAPTAPKQAPTNDEAREKAVLKLAEHEHGRVTIPEVAARCDLTIAEAKAALDRMVMMQVAYMQVTSSGGLVYVFPGFMSDEEKARARDF